MSWNVVYLIFAIVCMIMAVWKISRHGNFFIAMVGILWFLTILFYLYVPSIYNFTIIRGIPSFGRLIHFVAMPVFIILSLSSHRSRY